MYVHVSPNLHGIVLEGNAPFSGDSVLEYMTHLKAHGDVLRRILLIEPRGGHLSLFPDPVFEVAWTGALYQLIDDRALGFGTVAADEEKLMPFDKAFVPAAQQVGQPLKAQFCGDGPSSFVVVEGPSQKNVETVGEHAVCCYEYPSSSVSRSPAGVPNAATAVQTPDRADLQVGDTIRMTSIFVSNLQATINRTVDYFGAMGALMPNLRSSWITIKSNLVINFVDPVTPCDGFTEFRRL